MFYLYRQIMMIMMIVFLSSPAVVGTVFPVLQAEANSHTQRKQALYFPFLCGIEEHFSDPSPGSARMNKEGEVKTVLMIYRQTPDIVTGSHGPFT